MSVSAMKQALEALEFAGDLIAPITENCQCQICLAHTALRQAIEQAEKQEAVAWMWKDGTLTSDPDFADGTWTPLFTAPVYPSDILQEPVDETAKDRHEFEEMVKKGTKAWAGTPDDWVDELRGGREYVLDCPRCGHCCHERKWVGLTDKEIVDLACSVDSYKGLCQATEAKLKEKNVPQP